MKDGPMIANVAALLGDPARANMAVALMEGRALTVSELAQAGGVGLSTASGHLSKLNAAGLLAAEKQGRHRYYRLSGPDVADVLEALMGLAQRTGATRVRTGPKEPALRAARICYDHLAGEKAVALAAAFIDRRWIRVDSEIGLTGLGRDALAERGVDVEAMKRGKRSPCRLCLDWSERRNHLAGALGATLLDFTFAKRWARRGEGRLILFSASGARDFHSTFIDSPTVPSSKRSVEGP